MKDYVNRNLISFSMGWPVAKFNTATAKNFRWNHFTSQPFGCIILHDKPITHTLLDDV